MFIFIFASQYIFIAWGYLHSDLQQLEWEAPVFSTLKAKSPRLAGRLPARRCFEGIIFLQSHLVKLRLISPVTPFPTLNVSSPVLTISCTGISIDPLKLFSLQVQYEQITQMHGHCTSSKQCQFKNTRDRLAFKKIKIQKR